MSAGGLRERQREKVRQRILDSIRDTLEPGEELVEWTVAQVRPRLFLGLEALFGPLMIFSIRQYWVAASNRRLFALRISKRSAKRLTLELAEAFEHLRIERDRTGILWTKVWVRRPADGTLLRFRIVRSQRSRAERVFASLPRA